MTKLEEEILIAFKTPGLTATRKDLAKAAAKVSKRHIEKALNEASDWMYEDGGDRKTKSARVEKWLKDNGITE